MKIIFAALLLLSSGVSANNYQEEVDKFLATNDSALSHAPLNLNNDMQLDNGGKLDTKVDNSLQVTRSQASLCSIEIPQSEIDPLLEHFTKIKEMLFKNNLELLMKQNSFPRKH